MTDRNDRKNETPERIKSLSEKSVKELRNEMLRKEIGDFSAMEPEQVAQLLRNWLNSEK
ncbi:MAG: hypothetical protein J6N15_04385 [Ruminiclostridium sp.]|nr:hypothetical protein [Ruminiclostridium sp.]